MSIVLVIDSIGQICLPTHPARARKLLREGRATVKEVTPFTIQLTRKIDNPVGSSGVELDQDVVNKMERRRNFSRARKSRLRCRTSK